MSMSTGQPFTEPAVVLKVELLQFDGKGDYPIWKQNVRVILIQQMVAKVLEDFENFYVELKAKPNEVEEMNEIAYSFIILHLSKLGIYELHLMLYS